MLMRDERRVEEEVGGEEVDEGAVKEDKRWDVRRWRDGGMRGDRRHRWKEKRDRGRIG